MKKVYTYTFLLLASIVPFDLVPREQRFIDSPIYIGQYEAQRAQFLDDLDVVLDLIAGDPEIDPYRDELNALPIEVQTSIRTYPSPGRGELFDIEHKNELTVTIKHAPTHVIYSQFMKEDPNTIPQRQHFLKRWFHDIKNYVTTTNFYKTRIAALAESIKKRCRSDIHVRDSIEGDPSCSDTLFKIIAQSGEQELDWSVRPTSIFTSKITINLI